MTTTKPANVGEAADRLNDAILAIEDAFVAAGLVIGGWVPFGEFELGWGKFNIEDGREYVLMVRSSRHHGDTRPLTSASLALRTKAASVVGTLYQTLVRAAEGGQHDIVRAADTFFELANTIEKKE